MEYDMNYNMYGISQSPFGNINPLYVHDVLENLITEERTKKVVDEYVKSSSAITRATKALESELHAPMMEKMPQTIGGGALFRVKSKRATYKGKYA